MTALPPSSDFTDSAVTEGGFKTAITNLRDYLSGLFGTTGNIITALVALGAMFNSTSSKSSNYTVIASDRGKTLECTGTIEVALTAASTLGDGFVFTIKNSGSGTITINPSGTELIDGEATITLTAGQSFIVYCNGSTFYTVGKGGVTSLNGQKGEIVNTSLYAVGGYVVGRPQNTTQYNVDSTVAGSTLYATGTDGTRDASSWYSGLTPTLVNVGTWRCVSPAGNYLGNGFMGLWVRIS